LETIRLTESNAGKAAERAAEVLRAGGVVLYPTDTLYGLGADAFSDEAVAKIYIIKGRDEKKPVHCIVADLAMAKRYAEVNEPARELAEKFLPGPLTLVLKKDRQLDTGIARGVDTLGVRIPQSDFCLALAKRFGAPYTTTSANIAGASTPRSAGGILSQLGGRAAMIDLVIDAGKLPDSLPSTVVDVSSRDLTILREGAIPAERVLARASPGA
jgi:L-threonylcarbamoyladenylate synthase